MYAKFVKLVPFSNPLNSIFILRYILNQYINQHLFTDLLSIHKDLHVYNPMTGKPCYQHLM